MTQIGHRSAPLPVHPAELIPTNFTGVAHQRAAMTNGNLTRNRGVWDRLISPSDDAYPIMGYLIGDDQAPQGYIIFEQVMGPTFDERYLQIRDMVALTAESHESLGAFLYGHRSIFPKIRYFGSPLDPFLATTREARAVPLFNERWMLRIIDVTQALSLRGYHPDVTGTLDFSVIDPLISENNSHFRLKVENGTAHVTRGGNGELKVDVRGLAPLYSSLLDAETLQSIGLLSAPSKVLQRANAIFAGPQPWMPDKF